MRTVRWIIALVALTLVSISGASRAQAGCAEIDSRWGHGLTRDVAHSMGTVYYGTGTELVAVSASTDLEIGRLDVGGVIHAIDVGGSHAFLAGAKRGLIVVDVSNPAQMQVLAHTDEPSAANSVAVDGGTAVVTEYWRGLFVFDVTNPGSPVLLSTLDVDGLPDNVALEDDIALTCEQDTGVRVIDLSDPTSPTELALLDTPGSANGATVVGSDLLVADGNAGLLIADLSDPSNPSVTGSLSFSGSAQSIAVSGTTAWIAADYGGYHAVDISNTAAPVLLGSDWTSVGTPADIDVAGSRVWLANWNTGVSVVDGSDPSNPQEVGLYPGAGQSRSVAALGEYAVVADWSGLTLRVLDLSPAQGPEQIGALELPGYPRQMEIASNTAYIALEWGDFVVVDLSDPTNPVLIGSVTVPGNPQWVALMGSHALVATQSDGLHVVDITHPETPSLVGKVETPGNGWGVTVSGTTAYVAAGSAGVVVVDLKTPTNPTVLGSVDIGALALQSAVAGDHLIVAGYYSGLFSVNVSDPANPTLTAQVSTPGTTRSVVVSGNLAFVGAGNGGLATVDISDPANMAVTGSTVSPGEAYYGAFVGSEYVLANDDAGVVVFDVSACGQGPEPPHADFSYVPSEPEAGETVTFTDLSTGDPTSWNWQFGNDGGTSSVPNPTHVFTSAGAHEVELQVSNVNGSSTAVRTIIVQPAPGEKPPISFPFASTTVIPAVAHVGGAQGTAWVTDVVFHNPGSEPVTIYAFFMESDTDSSNTEPVRITVPADQSYLFDDVVQTFFGATRSTGAILIGADRPLMVSSRTYNNSAEGTYGQYIAGLELNDALTAGESATVIQLSAGSFRSNLGVANTSDEPIKVVAEIYSGTGQRLDTRNLQVPPWSHLQINGVFAGAGTSNLADGYAVLRCSTSNALWFAYASVVDNRSGDPVYIEPVDVTSKPLWIAAAARAQGTNDTNWRTDLEIFTGSPAPNELTVGWHGTTGGSPNQAELRITTTPCQRVEDVLDELYSSDGSGALRIEADQGELAVTSRTFNDPGDETYGQFIPAVPESDVLTWGEVARLVQLVHSPNRQKGFRTNLGFVNTTGQPTTVFVELRDWDGSVIGSLTANLGPYQYTQLNNVFKGVVDRILLSAYAIVYTSTGGAGYFAYASVVDNRSGDPIYIPAMREP